MLGISQGELEASSRVTKKTIADFERAATSPQPRTLDALRSALEAAGVEFIPKNGGGPGVRLRGGGKRQEPSHELRSVGPEDETRSGPQAPEQAEIQTDD